LSLAPAPDDGMGKLIVDAIRAALQVRAGHVLTPEIIEDRARNAACWVLDALFSDDDKTPTNEGG